jgi:cytochrome P450
MVAASTPNTDDFDIHEPSFVLNPYPAYEYLRNECPVVHGSKYGGYWLLTRFDDVRDATRDWRTYTSSVVGNTAIPQITRRSPDDPALPIELDPPLHSRYRALINPVFSPQRIEGLRPVITALVAQLVDRFIERGGGDLVADYAVPLSVGTLAEFTGFPKEDSDRWVSWIQRMFNVYNREDGALATQEIIAYVYDLIARRREQPCGDFISLLIESEVDGHRLTDYEIRSYTMVQFGAGFETTADALSVMFHYLAEHPEARQQLVDNPDLIPSAVEEFLRYSTPIQIFGRNTTHDVELHGQTMKEGDIVALGFGSANHDPTVFPEPERCVLDRTPNPHLTFGAGVHLCLGAPVARLEMQITLDEFIRRVPPYRVAGAMEWKPRGDRRGLAHLPVVIES